MVDVRHPAPWNRTALAAAGDRALQILGDDACPIQVLDPFAGIGRIHELSDGKFSTVGGELEPEWADLSDGTIVANALDFPAEDDEYDAVVTSPCVGVDERVLTADLRWVTAGSVEIGDRLLAFDESSPFTKENGHRARRKYRIAVVTGAGIAPKRCVRVILANGDAVVCSEDHPWLTQRYAYGSTAEWTRADRLMGSSGTGRSRVGRRQPFYVLREMTPWEPDRSYEAGWLAGMFDGEGSLSFGEHGSPKLVLTQNAGPVLDRAESLLGERVKIARYAKAPDRQDCHALFVGGGIEDILRTLGTLRPERLLAKFASLDVWTRTIEPEPVAVVAVEPAGIQDVATITTTTATYITEGYLHHNTWGNRMADHHEARDACKPCGGTGRVAADAVIEAGAGAGSPGTPCPVCDGSGLSRRNTYRHALGRMPSDGASSILQFGPQYRRFHRDWIVEAIRLVRPGGLIVVNMANHIRKGVEVDVVGWWLGALIGEGLYVRAVDWIPAAKMRVGSNADLRVDGEVNIVMQVRG